MNRPILFSGEMVRAILAGTKTQTRRLIDLSRAVGEPEVPPGHVLSLWCPGAHLHYGTRWDDTMQERTSWQVQRLCSEACEPSAPGVYPPTGHVDWRGPVDGYPGPYDGRHPVAWGPMPFWPGLHLWVKETWQESDSGPDLYAADYDSKEHAGVERWRSPLFMRRDQSRISLEVTSVRPERLQAISEDDAKAEGATLCGSDCGDTRSHFQALWDSINRKQAPWASNPWVWVVGFKRIAKLEAAA